MRSQRAQAGEQDGLAGEGSSNAEKQAAVGSSDHSCLQKLLLELFAQLKDLTNNQRFF